MKNNLIAIIFMLLISMLGAMFYYRNQYNQMLKQAEERQAVIYRLSQQIQAVSTLDAKYTEELTLILKLKLISCMMLFVLVLSGCVSKPCVMNPTPPPPRADMMKPLTT